jgi:hypothetical protein
MEICRSQSGMRVRSSQRRVAWLCTDGGWRRCEARFLDEAADEKRRYGNVRQSRPLSGLSDEERTLGVSNR